MKIVFLSFYSGWIHRGIETVVDELSKRFGKNHQVLLVQAGPKPKTQKSYEVERKAVKIKWPEVNSEGLARKLMVDYYYLKIALFTIKSLSSISKFNPDIVIPVNGGWQSLIIKIYCLVKKAKMVVMGQAGLGWDDRWNLLIKPDLFIALSERNVKWAKKHALKKQRIAMIPNGVNTDRFKVQACLPARQGSRFKVDLEKPVILCVAGHEKFKRVKETIDAAARLEKGSLFLACSSSVYDMYGQKKLGQRFLRKSFSHTDMPQVYQSADLFTLVSKSNEAFGIAYLEAMACGLPVVATDDGLRREIIGGAGLFVKDPADQNEYSSLLKRALKINWKDKPEKQAEKYSFDKIALTYEKNFKKLIKHEP